MLKEAGPEMIEETQKRINNLKADMLVMSEEEKMEVQKYMSELQYILMQTAKNVEVADAVIENLEKEWRILFRKEMADKVFNK